jgi:hypothetical protein
MHVMHHIIISFFPFKKPLAKEIVMKRSRSLAPMQSYWDLKNYSSTQNGWLQRRANGKNVNHVLME